MSFISHTTTNGRTLVLGKEGPELHVFVATPTNRQGILEWLLKNSAKKEFVDKVLKFLDAENEAARSKILKTKGDNKVQKAPDPPPRKVPPQKG